jgi:D-Tyr-tRNA(Tyr) deacylase
LLASTKKGSKPDFHGAMGGDRAKELYELFVTKVEEGYQPEKVKDGVFKAKMEVALVNDGPVRPFLFRFQYYVFIMEVRLIPIGYFGDFGRVKRDDQMT